MNTNDAAAKNADERAMRVAWVDYAKGICIIMVVMMHVTHDYGVAIGSEGWLHEVVAFARPFRMPDFFLLAGIFLSLSINSSLRDYVDRKFVHFLYFYFIWLAIQLSLTETELLLENPSAFVRIFVFAWIEPVNTLWFVHMLAIFYMVTRLLRRVPKALVLLVATCLQLAFALGWIDTGWSVADRFFDRYVYFFAGYAVAPWIFAFARRVTFSPQVALGGLLIWGLINWLFTSTDSDMAPGVSLLLGFAGAAAIVSTGSLLAKRSWTGWLRYCGANSIVIYLSFFLPMKVGIKLLAFSGLVADVGTATALITVVAVILPLLFHSAIRQTRLRFLYERPRYFGVAGLVQIRGRY